MPKASKKAPKVRYCAASQCKLTATTGAFCRTHYISHWKEIREEKKMRAEKKLNAYVERLAEKYPADFMDKLKETLEDKDKFLETIQELELTEESETDREFLERFRRSLKDE